MIKLIAFITIIALRIFYQPSSAQTNIAPFASPAPLPTTTRSIAPAKFISIDGRKSNHHVILNWTVGQNETADQFEVEKSSDGKLFSMAALVFGTDETETGTYRFSEKTGKKKMFYRIKLINKNQETIYSTVVEINPKA